MKFCVVGLFTCNGLSMPLLSRNNASMFYKLLNTNFVLTWLARRGRFANSYKILD